MRSRRGATPVTDGAARSILPWPAAAMSLALALALAAVATVTAAPPLATRRARPGFLLPSSPPSPSRPLAAAGAVPRWLLTRRGGACASSSSSGSSNDTAPAAPAALLLPVPAFNSERDLLESEDGVAWAQLLLESFERTVGRPLMARRGDARQQAQDLFNAPRVVVSHQTQADPVLCYGNARALALWEMDVPTLTGTPSRLTAEPVERAERQRLLDAVKAKGYIDDYQGVRVSSTGKRFMIRNCIVWEVFDAAGVRRGQAATFDEIEPLG